MKQLIQILTVDSFKDLLRYKSFVLLIFFLMAADRAIHRAIDTPGGGIALPKGGFVSNDTAHYVFSQLPGDLLGWLLTPRVALIAVGLFMLKQVISLWPSSDMRRMHRSERGRFGLLEALMALRWFQIAWDAVAVATACLVAGVWFAVSFLVGRWLYHWTGTPYALVVACACGGLILPLGMAGFSYSSKLAVISKGSFGQRLSLFALLLTDLRMISISWLFFTARIIIEFIFVAAIPTGAILLIDQFWIRMLIATLSAAPVYSYLKMASFKFFLEAYRPYPLVRKEYGDYYRNR